MSIHDPLSTQLLTGSASGQIVDDLVEILLQSVHGGASVGFVLPFDPGQARGYWESEVFPQVESGRRLLWIAVIEGKIVGTVQLIVALPPNQPHRGEVSKLLIHPAYRRRGIARRLMAEMEAVAWQRSKTLLTLDTKTGDNAEPLYRSLGYHVAGTIPGYCLDALSMKPDSTTYMYKVRPTTPGEHD